MLCWLTVLALWGTYTLTLLCWDIWLDFLRYALLYLADSLLLNVSYMTEDFLTFNYLWTFWSRHINSWVCVWAQSSSSGLWILKEREVSYFLQSWCFPNVGWINVHFFLTGKKLFRASSWMSRMQGLWMSTGSWEKMRRAWNMLNAVSRILQDLVFWIQKGTPSLGF